MNDICGKDWEFEGDGDHGDPGNVTSKPGLLLKIFSFRGLGGKKSCQLSRPDPPPPFY